MSEEEGAKLKVALRYVVIVTRHTVLKNKNMSKMKINKNKKYICICKWISPVWQYILESQLRLRQEAHGQPVSNTTNKTKYHIYSNTKRMGAQGNNHMAAIWVCKVVEEPGSEDTTHKWRGREKCHSWEDKGRQRSCNCHHEGRGGWGHESKCMDSQYNQCLEMLSNPLV